MQTISWQLSDRRAEIDVFETGRSLVMHILTDVTFENSARIRTAVLFAWEARERLGTVILDMGGVHHIDSSGVGVLLELAQKAARANIPFVLCGLEASPRRVLDRTGLSELFRISNEPSGCANRPGV